MREGTYRQVTVTTSGNLIASADPHRRFLELQNGSGDDISVAFGRPAVLGRDFAVSQFNKAEKFRYEDLGELLTLDVYAISQNQTDIIPILEGFARHG